MADEYSLINIGKLSKPAETLINRVSEAVGGIAKPWQIKRVAKAEAEAAVIKAEAEAEAAIIKAKSDIEVTELEQRAIERMMREEADHQKNIENITYKAIPYLSDDAAPEEVDRDWLAYFFNKSRIVSDGDMQILWSKLLAGEANKKNSFSKRTIELVSMLEKGDAELFTKFCSYVLNIDNEFTPLIFEIGNQIYKNNGVTFETLNHLDDIGLVTFDGIAGYRRNELDKMANILYFTKEFTLELPKESDNEIDIGHVLFTQSGIELFPISGAKYSQDFLDYAVGFMCKEAVNIHMPD